MAARALSPSGSAYGTMGPARGTGTCMSPQRRSYESGHKPKCLVIVDDSSEWDRAVHYASRWAARLAGGVVMLRIIGTAGRANGIAAIPPERAIREGDPIEQILGVIEQDPDIAMLVLAANPGPEGPGPLVTLMASAVGSFPIPITIVP